MYKSVSSLQTHFAASCHACGKLIGLDSRDLSYRDLHWHEACFQVPASIFTVVSSDICPAQCAKCHVSLLHQAFAATPRHGILCGGCYDQVAVNTRFI